MADRLQEGQELHRPAVLHRCAGEQPDHPQAGMTRQAQESLGAARGTVLGIVGLIGDHQSAGLRQGSRKPGPAVQLKPQAQGCRLLSPVGMETHRSDHQDAAIRQTHEGPGGHQGGEGLAQTHGIGEHRTTAGQQPAHGGPLMGQ